MHEDAVKTMMIYKKKKKGLKFSCFKKSTFSLCKSICPTIFTTSKSVAKE